MGQKQTPEARAKMSAAKEGRPGRPHSPETRAKISAAKKGRTRSPETRAKLSAALKGRRVVPREFVDQFEAILDRRRAGRSEPATSPERPRPAIEPGTADQSMSVRGAPQRLLTGGERRALKFVAERFPGGLTGKELTRLYGGKKHWWSFLKSIKDSGPAVAAALLFPRDEPDSPTGGLYRIAPW